MSSSLNNYLRMYRKQHGLTQEEVATLLTVNRNTVRLHEQGTDPTLAMAIRYEVIYGEKITKLFEGRYEENEADVRALAVDAFDEYKPGSGDRPASLTRLGEIAHPDDPILNGDLWSEEA